MFLLSYFTTSTASRHCSMEIAEFHKRGPSKYHGEAFTEPEQRAWVEEMYILFAQAGTPKELRERIAATCLGGLALVLWERYRHSTPGGDWEDMYMEMDDYFQNKDLDYKFQWKLHEWQRKPLETYAEYIAHFHEHIIVPRRGVTDAEMAVCFKKGVGRGKSEIKRVPHHMKSIEDFLNEANLLICVKSKEYLLLRLID